MLRISFVAEIDFCSCLLYNTASSDTFIFWVSLSNSDFQSKIIEPNSFDATTCPRLICSRFSQVKQSHLTSRPLRISQGACVQNTISFPFGDFFFAFFCCDCWVINLEFFPKFIPWFITIYYSRSLPLFVTYIPLRGILRIRWDAFNSLWKFDTLSNIYIAIDSLCYSWLGGNIGYIYCAAILLTLWFPLRDLNVIS